jgi:hypothetical protein
VESGNKTAGTSCGAAQSCSNNVKTAAATCNGSGACSAPTTNCTNGCNLAGTDCLSCGASEVACVGVCCAAGSACCGGACTNITTNVNSCGNCTNKCSTGSVCRSSGCVSNASCRVIKASGNSIGSGVYTLDPDGTGPIAAFSAYCDMTSNGGGYTLVVGVDAANRNHASSSAVTPSNLTSPSGKGKFSDDVIRALLATGTSELRFDVAATDGAHTRAWTAPNCVWDATATECSNHCGPDDSCKYSQPPIGLYMEEPDAIYSYASTGCGNNVSLYPGIRDWQGDDCSHATAIAGTVWVR